MAKSIVPFNYNEIYQQIAKKFLDRGYDIPYEGSNTAILTSILAYAIQSLNFNTAMNINEVILSLNKKRRSAVQNARILGYEPQHKISHQVKIYIKPQRAGTLNIPKYQEFKLNSYSYYYFGSDIIQYITEDELADSGVWITVKQGTLLQHADYPDVLEYDLSEEKQYIDIPFDDVENDGLIVTVDTYDNLGNKRTGVSYTKKDFNLQDISDSVSDQYYRKDDLDTGNCRIYFRLGGMGTALKEGSKIKVDVLRSDGSTPNAESFTGSIEGDLSGYAKIVTEGDYKPQNYIYGQDEESIESIQQNAPMFYNTAGRCITEYDYRTFLKLQNSVLDGYAWGGEDELVPQVGRIYYSCIPNLSEPEFVKQELKTEKVKTGEETLTDANGNVVNDSLTGEPIVNSIYETQTTMVETSDDSKVGLYRKLNYDTNLFISDGDMVKVVDTIKTYSVPGLQNYIKNPVYIFADLNVSIKKYEYGVTKSEIHQKIFDCIKAYFDERKGLNVDYVESTLIKQISEILGEDNGFTLDTLFSGYISNSNKVQMISKDFDYNSAIVSYAENYDGSTLKIIAYLNGKCSVGDTITFKFNQNATNGLYEISSSDLVLTANHINQGEAELRVNALDTLNLDVTWKSASSSSQVKANEVELNFKNIYYTTNIRSAVYTLNALLNPSVKSGDKYDIFLEKDGILNKIETITLKQSDIIAGEISYIYVDKTGSEDTKPDDLFIKFIKTIDGEETYLSSVKCSSIEECQTKLENDEDTLYDDIAGKSAFIVTNTKQSDNSYIIIMYLPSFIVANDTIEINYGNFSQTYKVTASDVSNRKATYTMVLEDLGVESVSYASKSDVVMTIIKYEEYDNEQLIPEADDRIQYSSEENSLNAIEYTPTTTSGNQLTLKSNFSCEFYKNFENKLDIRNIISNYGDLSDYEDGKNPRLLNLDVQVSSYEGANVKYEDFYVICTNPTKLSYVDVSVNMTTSQGVQFTSFKIPIKESSNSGTLSEGIGGIFMHLDIPPEGIYGDDGNLIIANLPKLYAFGLKYNNTLYNMSSMNQGNAVAFSRTNTDLSVLVYVDMDTENETILKGMYPYYISSSVNKDQADNTYKWIRFPIKASYGKTSTVIGTYIIINASSPYIRIKLRSEVINLFNKCEFEIVYPSNNLNTIRNTALRLRSVNITSDGENYDIRSTMKEQANKIDEDMFSSWGDTNEIDDQADSDESKSVE